MRIQGYAPITQLIDLLCSCLITRTFVSKETCPGEHFCSCSRGAKTVSAPSTILWLLIHPHITIVSGIPLFLSYYILKHHESSRLNPKLTINGTLPNFFAHGASSPLVQHVQMCTAGMKVSIRYACPLGTSVHASLIAPFLCNASCRKLSILESDRLDHQR